MDPRVHAPVARRKFRWFRVGILALFATTLMMPPLTSAAVLTYYVDCAAGNDSNLGLSQGSAWRSLGKASNAPLLPGDRLLFKRGCVWDGTLTLKKSGTVLLPITIGAYGSGNLPRIQNGTDQVAIYGSYLVIQYLHVRANENSLDAQCQNARVGQKRGFRFFSGAAYNVLEHSLATDLYGGIWLATGTHHISVRNNTLRSNNMKMEHPEKNDSSGAVGIAVQGDDSIIANNDITGSYVCSRVWGRDGAAIEVFGGRRNRIFNNIARDNHIFTEMGDSRSQDNIYAYNRVATGMAGAKFLTTRGDGNRYGPVYGTKVFHNSVHLGASDSWGVYCHSNCSGSVLILRNNIIWVNGTAGYSDAPFTESHNIYWRSDGKPNVRYTIASTSMKVDPQWVAPGSADYRPKSTSPAVDSANNAAPNHGFLSDLLGVVVPQGNAPDRGAYEYTGGGASPTPTPPPPGATVVSDTFGRTVSNGWGSAGTGGSYALDGPATSFSVDGSTGKMQLSAANANRAALLNGVSSRDVDLRFRVATSKRPTGGALYAYGVVRRSANNAYRPKLIMHPNGSVAVHAGVVVNNIESSIASSVTVAGLSHAASSFIWVRAQVTGSSPTTIRVKAWAAGQTEPSGWQFSATNSTSGVQSAGALGLRAYASSSLGNAPITFSFDDFTVTTQ
jgi:hypothetical protein